MIGRRAVLAGMAAVLAHRAMAQQRNGMRRLGVLSPGESSDPVNQAGHAALFRALEGFGWQENSNLHVDWRSFGADPGLLDRYAAELVSLGPEVLWTVGNASVEALRRQTSTIPIVFASVTDPVGQGFVASLARPGGNVTGFSSYDPQMAGKWLGMLTQIKPPVSRAAVLYSPDEPNAAIHLRTIDDAAPSFAVAVRAAPCRDDAEIEGMITGLAREEGGGLLILPGNFPAAHRDTIITLAAQHRLPAVFPFRYFVASGGLMSYGVDDNDLRRRSAAYIDRILKGDKPGNLPVQRPTKFELVIDLKTAQSLGLTVATPLLATADEVIE